MGELRIIGGRFRGRRVRSAAGSRPTQERVREALFSRWQSRLDGAAFLELFCGGGAVGLEALGRGAAAAVFVDRSAEALRTVARNCERLEIARPETVRHDLGRGFDRLLPGRSFDLVFADPPYGSIDLVALLESVARLLAPDGELALEHARRGATPATAGDLVRVDERRYGETGLAFYRHADAATERRG